MCAKFGENRLRNATVSARRRIQRLTDGNRFYNLSHAICYSYGSVKSHSAMEVRGSKNFKHFNKKSTSDSM